MGVDINNQIIGSAKMKIALKDIVMLFEEMEGELNISYVSIVIFVGVDVDSVCTLKMLSVCLI